LAALEVSDLKETEQGNVAALENRRHGARPASALPYGSDPLTCPMRALRSWLGNTGITEGPLFRAVDQFDIAENEPLHPDSIACIVKRAVERIGFEVEEFAGHSLCARLATRAAVNGAPVEFAIMKQMGHRSRATVRKYIREGSLFR
jgi:integrase